MQTAGKKVSDVSSVLSLKGGKMLQHRSLVCCQREAFVCCLPRVAPSTAGGRLIPDGGSSLLEAHPILMWDVIFFLEGSCLSSSRGTPLLQHLLPQCMDRDGLGASIPSKGGTQHLTLERKPPLEGFGTDYSLR